jgi:hypothetical protein
VPRADRSQTWYCESPPSTILILGQILAVDSRSLPTSHCQSDDGEIVYFRIAYEPSDIPVCQLGESSRTCLPKKTLQLWNKP